MTVYVVTSGDYSDYHIRGVFTVKEKAEKYVSTYNECLRPFGEAQIEQYEADAIAINGTWFDVSKRGDFVYCEATTTIQPPEERTAVMQFDDYYHVYVFADSQEKAKRIALDKFTAADASRAGV